MDKTRWLIFIGLCVAVIGGLIFFSKQDSPQTDNTEPQKIIRDSEIPDHTIGNIDSSVVLMEYADYQCPACTASSQNLGKIADDYDDKIVFVFRNYPLTSGHPHAFAAAATAEAAGRQGKFWEMHDLIFANHSEWNDLSAEKRNDIFEIYAKQLGLDFDKFTEDLSSKAVADKINRDRALGAKMGVDATPSIYLNGQKISDDLLNDLVSGNGEKLREKLDETLKQ